MFINIQEITNEILINVNYDEKSYISGTIYLNDYELYINYFYVDIKNRNKGIGTNLLNHIINSSKKYNIKTVHLVDESKNYRTSHNIYIKYGFKYLNNYNRKMIFML